MNNQDIGRSLIRAIRNGELETARELINSYGLPYSESSPKGYDLLCDALDNKHSEIAKLLLTSGSEVNSKTYNYKNSSNTPLHFAVINDDIEIIKMLLVRGANINTQNRFGQTPLHKAIENNDQVEIIELLLKHKADINAEDECRKTPLFKAIENKNLKITKLLLDNGANVKDDPKLLHSATMGECTEIVELLLQHNADVNVKDGCGQTPLYNAIQNNRLEIIELLLKHEADVNVKNRFGQTPLYNAVKNYQLEITELLLKHEADVNVKNLYGRTPLYKAIKNNQLEITELLLKHKADINAQDVERKTPLFYAIKNENLKITKLLLDNGVNVKDYPQLLNIAVRGKCTKIVELLLQHNADVNATDENGNTALLLNVSDYEDCYKYRTDRYSYVNIKRKITKLLLDHGANVDAQTPDSETLLQFAIWNEYSQVVEVLLEYNANVNVREKISLETPLHMSARRKNVEICEMLLNKGVDVDAVDCDGLTALHMATLEGSNDIVKLLLERGAKVDSKTKCNITPLHFSALNGSQEIMETLLKSSADINFRTIGGDTALHIASKEGHVKVVTTLLEYGSDINITTRNNRTLLDYAKTAETIESLIRHIIRMKTANLYVSQQNLLSVDGIYYPDFQEKCENEITSMKSEKMNNYNISFYDILIKNTDSLAICLRNENIVQILKLDDYKTKFPIYGSMIKSRFRNGMKRNELLDQGNKILHFLFANHLQLPQECTEKIFSYLSDEDLKKIIEKSKDK
ncbi:putative ankyrin repeat protein RF_0381 isoform X3 [Chrysoperla carnea]|uniref:putative ankyrin repeat protein RF_0381 isoform X2 n=1 Tax=Chrysoperla carnea TaxID=189513 RepID=UPI001D079C8C|nr:putative ankyrin repeat protein RF_0381 isoform X2 [Chrysoperla carnea]XP_044726606.1 putative ankyrin repeat protein RF_0381 isoform X3 [Chrysoperla carnea]